MRKALLTFCAAVMFAGLAGEPIRAEPTTRPSPAVTTPNPQTMRKLTFVLLVRPTDAPAMEPEAAAELQKRHLAHIATMAESGKLMVAGPFGDREDESLRGVLIFDCDIDEARAMANEDPAVKAGRMKAVCMSWWTSADALAFPWYEANKPTTNPAR
jgi:uncharacterized protein